MQGTYPWLIASSLLEKNTLFPSDILLTLVHPGSWNFPVFEFPIKLPEADELEDDVLVSCEWLEDEDKWLLATCVSPFAQSYG